MKKSKFVFIIMAVIYFSAAVLDGIGLLTITDSILLGLSLSALLSAISDILYNIGWLKTVTNEFNFIIRVAVEFLSEKQARNIPSANPNVNIKLVKQYIQGMSKNYKDAVRPVEYDKKKFITAFKIGSQAAFVVSIAVFVIFPLLSASFQVSISTVLTLGAFSAMCLNLYIEEAIADVLSKRNDDFMNKEHLIIQTAYPDFVSFFNDRLWIDDEQTPIKEKQEESTHADA